MEKELNKIRQVSNHIIETKNGDEHFKKDFTDFIMLDAIYQAAMFSDEKVFILFTGDGHFTSVAAFLKNRLRKKVVVYGVKDAFSTALKAASSEWMEIPSDRNIFFNCYKLILEYISYLDEHGRDYRPTFWGTIRAVSERNEIEQPVAEAALRQLIDQEYIQQKQERVSFNKQIRVLTVDWEKAIQDGLWNSETGTK